MRILSPFATADSRFSDIVMRWLPRVLAFSLLAVNCFAQSVSSYVFVSPHTGPPLADQQARTNLRSVQQRNAAAVADRVACSLTRSVRIADSLGVYQTGAENSLLLETDLGPLQTGYVASLLGRYEHQEFVLSFTPQPAGADRLWILRSDQPEDAVLQAVRFAQPAPLTVVEQHGKTEIFDVDFGSKLTDKLSTLTSQLRAASEQIQGSAELLGDADRANARLIFDGRLKSAEATGGPRLSSSLRGRRWRHATSPTCSVGISWAGE